MQRVIPLPALSSELRRAGGPKVSYRKLYEAALDGRIPAERSPKGRWTVAARDLPRVAQALGAGAARHRPDAAGIPRARSRATVARSDRRQSLR